MGATKKTKARKNELWAEIQEAVCKYEKCLFVSTDNVTSKQISLMRRSFRERSAVLICGKNTMMRAALTELSTKPVEGDDDYENRIANWVERPHLVNIIAQLRGNISLIFTNGDLTQVADVLDSQVRAAPAKSGAIAPKDVVIPAGPTGLDPRQTGFFGNLGIATKIVKAQIEILNDNTVIIAGDKITPGQASLLDKLKICPFEYKMEIKKLLMEGNVFDAAVLRITVSKVQEIFSARAANITALSLGSGYVTAAAAPHLIMNAFKNLAAISFATDFSFPQAAALKAAASAAPVAAAAGAGTAAAAKVEEKEEEEEEADMDMGGMFGDDDDY
jgi:large subunit ribosomal protein LP0